MTDRILIPIETCELTFREVMDEVRRLILENPDDEIFLDGDAYAIVARPRRSKA